MLREVFGQFSTHICINNVCYIYHLCVYLYLVHACMKRVGNTPYTRINPKPQMQHAYVRIN